MQDGFFVSNAFFDAVMPELSGNAFKVLCYTLRQTDGWQDLTTASKRKERDWISYRQYRRACGLGSDHTVKAALDECVNKKFIIREDAGTTRGGKPKYFYRLNREHIPDVYRVHYSQVNREKHHDDNREKRGNGSLTNFSTPDNRENRGYDNRENRGYESGEKRDNADNRENRGYDNRENRGYDRVIPRKSRLQNVVVKEGKVNNKNKGTATKSEVPQTVVGVVEFSPQEQLFSEFGIAITPTTIPLLEKKESEIAAWIEYARSQPRLENPQGLVIAGLTSGYAPPENGGQNGATSKEKRDAAPDRENDSIPADRHVVCG